MLTSLGAEARNDQRNTVRLLHDLWRPLKTTVGLHERQFKSDSNRR